MNTQQINNGYSDETRLALLEQSINNINNTLVRFEKRFDQIDSNLHQLESKLESQIEKIQSEARSHNKWTLGLISGLYFLFASSLTTIIIKFIH